MDDAEKFHADIEEFCDRFEDDWRNDRTPDIETYLAQSNGCDRRELLNSLIALDIEYSLRRKSRSQTLEEYTRRFSKELTRNDVTALAIKEYRYRQQWGDRPSVYEFFDRFPELRRQLDGPLRAYAARITPTIIGVYKDQKLVYEMRLSERLEIGRQQRKDPPPICSYERETGSRLVIAASDNRLVSRRQIVVEVVARDGIQVHNAGHNPIEIELSDSLSSGDSITLTRPTVLRIDEMAIRLSQP